MIDLIRAGIVKKVSSGALTTDIARLVREGASPRVRKLADEIAPFIVGLVDALELALRAAADPRAGRAIAFANGQIFQYLLDGRDAFPEEDFGVFGLIDDAFLAHHHALALVSTFPWLATTVLGNYEPPSREVVTLIAALLPEGVAEALERTSRNVISVATSLIGVAPPVQSTPSFPSTPWPVRRLLTVLERN